MDPVTISMIAGALGTGSMMFDHFSNYQNAKRNFDLQRKAYFGQKRMNQLAQHNYENAVQIRANDYEKAGFNRLLAANGGVGSGPVLHVGNPAQMNYTSNIADKLMAYKNLKLLDQQMKMQEQQIELMKANKASVEADIDIKKSEAVLRKNEADSSNYGIYKETPYWVKVSQRLISSGKLSEFVRGGVNFFDKFVSFWRNKNAQYYLGVDEYPESRFKEDIISMKKHLEMYKKSYLYARKISKKTEEDKNFISNYEAVLNKYNLGRLFGYVNYRDFMKKEGKQLFDFL